MNYPVPSYGADPDIQGIQNSLSWAQEQTGHNWDFTFAKPPVNPAAATMYNFAPELDDDMKATLRHTSAAEEDLDTKWSFDDSEVQLFSTITSDPICSSAGCDQYKHPEKKSHPINYPVPSFGRDVDIIGTDQSLEAAEATVGKKWDFTFKKPPVNPAAKTDYNFAPELDENMKTSLKNVAQAEDDLQYTWDISAPEEEAALQLESDPICSSAGCEKRKSKKHPMDYFVPNFGRDTDILNVESSIDIAQA